MKVSIITPVFNCNTYIRDCINSVVSQNYSDIEHIIIDGRSSDGTVEIVESYGRHISFFVSEKDDGIYDALNKGFQAASGDIVGILNADDYFPDSDVISAVANCFKRNDCDAVYGNLNYVERDDVLRVVRKWRSKPCTYKEISYGWMPAHPTFYIKRQVFKKFGSYSLKFGSCGDYELMLRYLFKHRIRAVFLDKLLVNMRNGGMSNGSADKLFKAWRNDYRILVHTGVSRPVLVLILKKLRKLIQFI